ncbi:MAG TPA: hypothetical protein VN700_12695, partial [Vicinamibacterales bacterium]|nr:hypothetical protein [Vicinamibacterales bacterium]
SSLEIAFFEARRKMRTLNAVVATGTDQPPATTAKIKTVSHTKIGTRPEPGVTEARLLFLRLPRALRP